MGYCDICGYPAPCGRYHGENADGTDIKATRWETRVATTREVVESAHPSEVDGWICPHDREYLLLREAYEHISTVHGDCLSCSAERLIIAGILDWQDRHPDVHRVS